MNQLPHNSPRQETVLTGRSEALSAIVLTYNEELNLPSCLDSLERLQCEVFVVDSGSTDSTVEIARQRGATVCQHAFENYAAQRNWAQESLPIRTSWVLHLDADERLTPEVVDEINRFMEHPPDDVAGCLLRKRSIFMGKWIRHGGHYPSYHLRLFRKGKGRCEDRLYDQHFVADGQLIALKHDYLDVMASRLSTWTTRHVRWAELEKQEMLGGPPEGQQVSPEMFGNPIQRRRWLRKSYGYGPLFARAFGYWGYRYFLRLGFLDGTEGLIFHFLQGFWFRFLVDAMIYENNRANRSSLSA